METKHAELNFQFFRKLLSKIKLKSIKKTFNRLDLEII